MSTVVRLSTKTHTQLTELAQQRQQPLAQVLAALVEAAWREVSPTTLANVELRLRLLLDLG